MAILVAALSGYAFGKWFVWRVEFMALLLWINGKGHTPPTKAEMDACVRQVVRKSMGLK